jgi:hypothetical protein
MERVFRCIDGELLTRLDKLLLHDRNRRLPILEQSCPFPLCSDFYSILLRVALPGVAFGRLLGRERLVMVLSIFAAVFAVLILSILLSSLFTVQSGDAAVIQRFGKFHRTAAAGLGIKLPFVETKMTLSLRVQQADLSMESKTRDNVFVSIPVSIQYAVDPRRIYEAVYTLSSPRAQMEAIVNNILLGHIPSMEFDEV